MESPPTPTPKEVLKKKLKAKREHRNGQSSSGQNGIPEIDADNNIFAMLSQVNAMLKQNPDMVKKVSKCVSTIFENKTLMESLVNEIKINTDPLDQSGIDPLDQSGIDPNDGTDEFIDDGHSHVLRSSSSSDSKIAS